MPEYTFRLTYGRNGRADTAETEWNGQTFTAQSTHGATMALARRLCEAGAGDGPWEALDSGSGAKRLYGRSLHGLAALTVEEGPNGPRFTKWKPFPVARRP